MALAEGSGGGNRYVSAVAVSPAVVGFLPAGSAESLAELQDCVLRAGAVKTNVLFTFRNTPAKGEPREEERKKIHVFFLNNKLKSRSWTSPIHLDDVAGACQVPQVSLIPALRGTPSAGSCERAFCLQCRF